jgi:hypothetical protein
MEQDLDRIRYLSRNFTALQGLRSVPFGIALILNAWLYRYYSPAGGNATAVGCGASLAVLGALYFLYRRIAAYYDRRLGRVEPRPGPWSGWWGALAAYLVFCALSWVDMRLAPPLSVGSLALAAGFGFAWWSGWRAWRVGTAGSAREPGPRRHYAVIAASFLLLSLLPLLAPPSSLDLRGPFRYYPILQTALGVALLAAGALDHRELVRHLREVPADGHEIAV